MQLPPVIRTIYKGFMKWLVINLLNPIYSAFISIQGNTDVAILTPTWNAGKPIYKSFLLASYYRLKAGIRKLVRVYNITCKI